jgi:hypothetical protein
MKKITLILTLKERMALTQHAKRLGLCRCTLMHKAMKSYYKDHRKGIVKRTLKMCLLKEKQ